MKKYIPLIISILCVKFTFSQLDKGKFVIYPVGFYHNVIMKDIMKESAKEPVVAPQPRFKMDFDGKNYPTDISKYKTVFHNAPVSQGNSGTCWAYAAVSFIESEVYRQNKIEVKLAEMFVTYYEYVDRAKYFVNTKGATVIGEGSEANAILRIMRNYGLMPKEAFSGLKNGLNYNNHSQMFAEIDTYLKYIKTNQLWNEDIVGANVKNILNKYIGTPPEKFVYKGKEYTPKSFMTDFLKISTNGYFSFMSTKEFPYNEKHELVKPDNWWHDANYCNVSLEDFMWLVDNAMKNGFSISVCGDVSEPGYDQLVEVAIIPTFDIPSEYINEDARFMRLENNSTSDDHCIHIVGYQTVNDENWYLIKDSGSGAFDGQNKGYRFYHEDYIKLKMINIIVNGDAARKILNKIIK
jgi:bleomycin hydrolase